MKTDPLVPGIERRLSAWMEIKGKRDREPARSYGPTITLSREFGCEAFPVSEELEKLFAERASRPMTVFDRSLIEKVSGDDSVFRAILGSVGSASLMDDLLAPLLPKWQSHEQAYTRLASAIVTIARGGNAIIVGRGAVVLTQKLENCFHFRLEAPLDFRVNSIARRLEIDHAEARRLVEQNQKVRERFIERFLNCDISASHHFHAVFDNSRSDPAEIAKCVYALVMAKWSARR